MPRIRTGFKEQPRRTDGDLVNRLVEELKSDRKSGQPIIHEQAFPTDKLRVTVIWDAWDRLPLEERTEVILQAFEKAENLGYRARIALASGLTVPEAYAAGMLPCQIIPVLRAGDSVTLDQCRKAMILEGASILFAPDQPQLRFATMDEAEAAQKRLIQGLPESADVWAIAQEVGRVEDWLQR